MSTDEPAASDVPREIAFYYPGPIWSSADWIKNLILFFDGVALLVPSYMTDRPEYLDPSTVAALRAHDLFHILEPEALVDKAATEKLATAMTDIITSGALDSLAQQATRFHELSYSRLGSYGDPGLAQMIFEELKARCVCQGKSRPFDTLKVGHVLMREARTHSATFSCVRRAPTRLRAAPKATAICSPSAGWSPCRAASSLAHDIRRRSRSARIRSRVCARLRSSWQRSQ